MLLYYKKDGRIHMEKADKQKRKKKIKDKNKKAKKVKKSKKNLKKRDGIKGEINKKEIAGDTEKETITYKPPILPKKLQQAKGKIISHKLVETAKIVQNKHGFLLRIWVDYTKFSKNHKAQFSFHESTEDNLLELINNCIIKMLDGIRDCLLRRQIKIIQR
jgi:hypothetical protein